MVYLLRVFLYYKNNGVFIFLISFTSKDIKFTYITMINRDQN